MKYSCENCSKYLHGTHLQNLFNSRKACYIHACYPTYQFTILNTFKHLYYLLVKICSEFPEFSLVKGSSLYQIEKKVIMNHNHSTSIEAYYFKTYVTYIKIIKGHFKPCNGIYHPSLSLRHL